MIKRSGRSILLLILFFGALVSSSLAQQQPKIGVVNSQEVLERSSEGKKVMARLQDTDKKNQADLTKLDDDIRQLQTKLNTQRLTLTDEAIIQLNSDLEKKQTDRKRLAEDSYRNMQDLMNRLFGKVQGELIPIIEQIGKEKGLDIIFDLGKSGAIFVNPAIELTEEVIKRYDASKAATK